MLEIDGSYGEGGGQILRTALSLSCVTGRSFRITQIRRQRKKPGLMPQHLAAVRAAQAISDAAVEGARPGSTALIFEPGPVRGGAYTFDIGTAGASSLVLQTLILPLLHADRTSRILLTGGTHVPTSPSMTYLEEVFVPMLEQLGGRVRVNVEAFGFYPRGGGRVMAEIRPSQTLHPFTPGPPAAARISGVSAVCNLPVSIAERQQRAASAMLGDRLGGVGAGIPIALREVKGPGQGTYLFLLAEQGTVRSGFTALGALGKRAETVGSEAAEALFDHLMTGAALDPHLSDQLVPYLALSNGESSFGTSCISSHLLTNLWVTQQFLPFEYQVTGEAGQAGQVLVSGGI